MSNPDYLGAAYHYDGAGRLLDRIFSNGQRTAVAYDAVGNVATASGDARARTAAPPASSHHRP